MDVKKNFSLSNTFCGKIMQNLAKQKPHDLQKSTLGEIKYFLEEHSFASRKVKACAILGPYN